MIKAGFIAGAVALVLVLASAATISPFCALCPGILVGLGAGYLAGIFDKPVDGKQGAKSGAIAGAIAGALGILGNIGAGVINAAVLAPSGNAAIMEMLGLPPADPTTIWIGQIAVACCIGLFNVALMAGLGAGGGALWFQFNRKQQGQFDSL